MSEEQVDILDEMGKIIATVPKSVAHTKGLRHATVIAELINAKGEYCFVRQAGDKQDAGQFVSPVGGHVSAGESYDQALIRECQEEVGITPSTYELVGQTVLDRQVIGRHENHLFVVYNIYTDEDPVLNHESVEYRWLTVDEIKSAIKKDPTLFGTTWHHVFKNLYPSIGI